MFHVEQLEGQWKMCEALRGEDAQELAIVSRGTLASDHGGLTHSAVTSSVVACRHIRI